MAVASDGLLDYLPTSAVGIIQLIAKMGASDVAQVGDLLINGRDDAVLAPRPPLA